MKKPEHWRQPATRVHIARDDRARTWAGKTADSKVRSEGSHLAAMENVAATKRTYQAAEAKKDRNQTDAGGATRETTFAPVPRRKKGLC